MTGLATPKGCNITARRAIWFCRLAMSAWVSVALNAAGRLKGRGVIRGNRAWPKNLTITHGWKPREVGTHVADQKGIPETIANYLSEQAVEVDKWGDLKRFDRHRSVLDIYAALLRDGFGFQVDRGATYWQELQKARELRDYYIHIEAAKIQIHFLCIVPVVRGEKNDNAPCLLSVRPLFPVIGRNCDTPLDLVRRKWRFELTERYGPVFSVDARY